MTARPLPPRWVTLVLCDAQGSLLGSLPPFEVAFPYWQEVGDVVAQARDRFALQVTVLRLLAATPLPDSPTASGPVTYLAELTDLAELTNLAELTGAGVAPPSNLLRPVDDAVRELALADHRLRLPYARPGGPASDLAWADGALAASGRSRTGPAQQQRTWNLSSIWRLPTADGPVWLKVVPPFFGHEGAMIARLRASPPGEVGHPEAVAEPIAVDGPRVLLRDVPGTDQYGARGPVLHAMVRTLVAIQAGWVSRLPELAGLGVPDWRGEPFLAAADDVVRRTAGELDPDTRATVGQLVAELPQRFAQLAACGVPDTLVHGDFHPGNVRAATGFGVESRAHQPRCVLLDWGDCGIGHPLFDQSAFLDGLPAGEADAVRVTWSQAWRDAVPGCDPERAAALIEPVSALRRATVYRMFLDRIEPTERVYHAADPRQWLTAAAALVSRGRARP